MIEVNVEIFYNGKKIVRKEYKLGKGGEERIREIIQGLNKILYP